MFKNILRVFEPAIKVKGKTAKILGEAFFDYFWWDLVPIISIPILITYIHNQDLKGIRDFSIFLIILYVFLWAIHLIIKKWEVQAKYHMTMYVQNTYFKSILLKENISLDKIGTGKIQSIVKNGLSEWVDLNYEILSAIGRTLFGLATGIYIVSNFGSVYVPYFILIIILSCIGFYYFKKVKLRYDEEINDIENEINKDYVRAIMSRQEIVFAGKENIEVKKIVQSSQKQLDQATRASVYDLLGELFISGTLTLLPIVGVLFFVDSNPLTPVNIAFLVSFIYFCSRFGGTLYPATWIIRRAFEAYPKIKTFWEFLDTTPDLEGYATGKKFVHKNGSIDLKNITLSYDDKKILKEFNLKIEGKQKIALIGRSGSGKTTVAKLISGFMRPNSGEVLIDSQDLKTVALNSYYKNIGYLTQDPMVFDGSVKENLLYSVDSKTSKKITDEKLFKVLKNAECTFITDLDTHIGEKGIRLSGGEKQRLAIAKLMLKNPEIIILDEPTSSLDSFSEDAITRALDKLFENKTVVIIAHRLQTVKKADVIFVMKKGKIIESGTSVDLIAQKGEYKKMVDLQSF